MRKLYRNPNFLQALLTIWLILLFLPGMNLMELSTENGTIPVSFCYLFSVLFLPFLFFQLPKMRIPPWYITGLYVFVLLWALVQAPGYGLSKNVLQWAFGAFLLLVLMNLGEYLNQEKRAQVLEWGVLAFFVCHFIFSLAHWQEIEKVVFQGEIASSLSSLSRGGRNLDATWLGLGCFLIRNKKARFACLIYSFAYAAIGVSRAGLIASGLCLLWILFLDRRRQWNKKTVLLLCGLGVAGIGAAFALGLAQRMIDRVFFGFGEGSNSFLAGRESLWQNVWPMLKSHPLGVGVGNAVKVMRSEYAFAGYEDVIHNVFFQWTLDEGIVGGLWYLALAGLLFYSQRGRSNGWFRNEVSAWLLGYGALSLFQFHGGEALMVFVMGCYLLNLNQAVPLTLPRFFSQRTQRRVSAE